MGKEPPTSRNISKIVRTGNITYLLGSKVGRGESIREREHAFGGGGRLFFEGGENKTERKNVDYTLEDNGRNGPPC